MTTIRDITHLPWDFIQAVAEGVALGWQYTRPIQSSSTESEANPRGPSVEESPAPASHGHPTVGAGHPKLNK